MRCDRKREKWVKIKRAPTQSTTTVTTATITMTTVITVDFTIVSILAVRKRKLHTNKSIYTCINLAQGPHPNGKGLQETSKKPPPTQGMAARLQYSQGLGVRHH